MLVRRHCWLDAWMTQRVRMPCIQSTRVSSATLLNSDLLHVISQTEFRIEPKSLNSPLSPLHQWYHRVLFFALSSFVCISPAKVSSGLAQVPSCPLLWPSVSKCGSKQHSVVLHLTANQICVAQNSFPMRSMIPADPPSTRVQMPRLRDCGATNVSSW